MKAMTTTARHAPAAVLAALLLVSLIAGLPCGVLARPAGYSFTPLAFLGDPAPGGGNLTNDFEPYGINNRGEASFGADLTTGGEGVFVARHGQISEIARSGGDAPGGGRFGFFGFFGALPINDPGDVPFVFALGVFHTMGRLARTG